jgi:hypothetical protein
VRRSIVDAASPPTPVLGTPGVAVPVVLVSVEPFVPEPVVPDSIVLPVFGTPGAIAGVLVTVVPLPVVAPLAGWITLPLVPVVPSFPVPVVPLLVCAAATPADKRNASVAALNAFCNFIFILVKKVILETLMFDLVIYKQLQVKQW